MARVPNPNEGKHNIVAARHWPEAECLEIEFQGGKIARYFHVEGWRAEEFWASKSWGRYHGLHIKSNEKYPFMYVTAEQAESAPGKTDYVGWLRKGEDQLKDEKIFNRDRDADRAGMLGETRRARKLKLL